MSAETVGPPKRRAGDDEVERQAIWARRQVHLASCRDCLVSEVVNDDFAPDIIVGYYFDFSGHSGDGSRYLLWQDVQVLNARLVPGLQKDRTPNTAGDKPRAPIPAKLIRRLACVWTCLFSLIVASRQLIAHFRHPRQDFINRRTKADAQRVDPGF